MGDEQNPALLPIESFFWQRLDWYSCWKCWPRLISWSVFAICFGKNLWKQQRAEYARTIGIYHYGLKWKRCSPNYLILWDIHICIFHPIPPYTALYRPYTIHIPSLYHPYTIPIPSLYRPYAVLIPSLYRPIPSVYHPYTIPIPPYTTLYHPIPFLYHPSTMIVLLCHISWIHSWTAPAISNM